MGVDPGTVNVGVGFVENVEGEPKALHYETIALNKRHSMHKRLHAIYSEICKICNEWKPDIIALEDIFFGASFRSAVRIGEARCAVILAATECGIGVVEYPPARVKSSVCGFGRAAKVQMQNMVKHILHLKELPQTDAADALAIAICHIHMTHKEILKAR